MNTIQKLVTSLGVGVSALTFAFTGLANAAPGHTLFGEAGYVNPGYNSNTAVQTVSDSDPGWGGINFEVPVGTTFADLETLSTYYKITEGDCGGGSPRFQLETPTGNIFIYIGDYPNYTDCEVDTWLNTGDLLESGMYVDSTQLGGGFYQSYDDALTQFGDTVIMSVSLATDGGWAVGGNQTVLFDDVNIDGEIHDFEPELTYPATKDECKKDGWKTFTGVVFKNQGDCVSSVVSKGRANN